MLTNIKIIISGVLIATSAFFGNVANWFNPQLNQQPINLGSIGQFTPVQVQKTYLSGAGVGTTDTSIVLTSLKLVDGTTNVVMSNFGSIGYATIDPGVSKKEENISFTGITQNAIGTATLTGVSRGLLPVYPYTASTSISYSHSGGATVVFSNSAPFYSQFAIANNTTTINANWTFNSSTIPRFSADTTNAQIAANNQNFVNYATLASTSIAGAVPATNANAGIVKIAVSSDLAQGNSTTTYSLVPDAQSFNQTSSAKTLVPVTKTNGKLSQGFLDLTEAFNFLGDFSSVSTTISGILNISSSTTFSYLPTIPTSTPASNNPVSKYFFSNNSSLIVMPATSTMTSTYTCASSNPVTIVSSTIPANTFGSNDIIDIYWSIKWQQFAGAETPTFRLAIGTTTITSYIPSGTNWGTFKMIMQNATNSQISYLTTSTATGFTLTRGTNVFDFSIPQDIFWTAQCTGSGDDTATVQDMYVTKTARQ